MEGKVFLAMLGLRWLTPDETRWHLEHLEQAAEPCTEGSALCADQYVHKLHLCRSR